MTTLQFTCPVPMRRAAARGIEATPRPSAAVPGHVNSRCSGGDSSRREWRKSLPCQISAPAVQSTS